MNGRAGRDKRRGILLDCISFYLTDYGGELDEEAAAGLLPRAEREIMCVCSDEAAAAFRGGGELGGRLYDLRLAVCVQADFLGKLFYENVSENASENVSENVSGGGSAGGGHTSNSGNGNGQNPVNSSEVGTEISSMKLGDFSVNFSRVQTSSGNSGNSESSENSGSSESSDNSCGSAAADNSEIMSVPVSKSARGMVCGEALMILDKAGFLFRGGVRL